VTTSYTYEDADILREIRGASSFRYVHGPGIDEPLAREDGAGALSYYHADALGSIVKWTSQAGGVVQEYRHDAWGNMELGASEPGYAFTGREWDPNTGLYYYRARYYDPKAARFASEDPIGFAGGVNFYEYVSGNPVNSTDPLGLQGTPLKPRTCWKFLGPDETVTCSDDHPTPPTCVVDGTCVQVPDPCPCERKCRPNWDRFKWCFVSGGAAPGPDRHRPPSDPPDRPGIRGASAGGQGGKASRSLIIDAFNRCATKTLECEYVRGDCARQYMGSGK
jgi:RHS repeat-associated protein